MYDEDQQKGVKKQFIPAPRVVDFDRFSSYSCIIEKGKDIFFNTTSSSQHESSNNHQSYFLAGTSGVPFDIDDDDLEDWSLQDFMKQHGYVPSKFRLYVVLKVHHTPIYNAKLIIVT